MPNLYGSQKTMQNKIELTKSPGGRIRFGPGRGFICSIEIMHVHARSLDVCRVFFVFSSLIAQIWTQPCTRPQPLRSGLSSSTAGRSPSLSFGVAPLVCCPRQAFALTAATRVSWRSQRVMTQRTSRETRAVATPFVPQTRAIAASCFSNSAQSSHAPRSRW